ncbi:ATP-binding protein [bacterium]|nr:ATP-binding protein [bacterium]
MKYFPFTALVGQDRLKTAYLANIVNPNIGGLLISGVKGIGKSTLVRSVEDILPDYVAVRDCQFNCDPSDSRHLCSLCQEKDHLQSESRQMRVVNLPLSISEDRLIGSIEIEKLLKTGEKDIQVGILGQANRNILYIDEVNLLPDHIVDDILDAAASHWNTIEREGFSISHPAEFVLVGTMNPEEGDLRPQILDRFPIGVTIKTVTDPAERVEIIKRNLLFEADPERFMEYFHKQSEMLKQCIIEARIILPGVTVAESSLLAVASACAELKVDGQRPDIVIVKVARATTALEKRNEISAKDIVLAAILTLAHRTRDGGLLGPPTEDEISEIFQKNLKTHSGKPGSSFSPRDIWSSGTVNMGIDEKKKLN